jgi:hypothetical protein
MMKKLFWLVLSTVILTGQSVFAQETNSETQSSQREDSLLQVVNELSGRVKKTEDAARNERIWKKIVENDFKVMPQNSSLRVPTSLNRNYKNIKENGTVIFLKLKYVCTDTVYYDLVESMALTFLEELFKEMGKIQESDIFVDIFQPIKDFRYIRITVRKKINLNCIYNVYKKIVNRLILKKDIERLLEDLKNEYGYQYIQHLIYSYIFDRKSYTNHDLMQYIEAESKKVFDDIIQFSISNLKDPQYYIYYLERR